MSVKRYEFDPVFKEDYEDDEGEWVTYADHLSDRSSLLAVLRQCVEAIDREAKWLETHSTGWRQGNQKRAKELRAALAAAKANLETNA